MSTENETVESDGMGRSSQRKYEDDAWLTHFPAHQSAVGRSQYDVSNRRFGEEDRCSKVRDEAVGAAAEGRWRTGVVKDWC